MTATERALNEKPHLRRAHDELLRSSNPRAADLYRSWYRSRVAAEYVDALRESKSLEYAAPTLIPLPELATLAPAPHPDSPLRLQSQLDMETIFRCEGRRGLQKKIYEIARHESRLNPTGTASLGGDSSWEKVLRDENSGKNYVYHLLMTCKDEFLLSMIRGTLAFDLFHNQEVCEFYMSRIAWDGPAIYGNRTLRGDPKSTAAAFIPDRGRWLNKLEIDRLLREVETYIANDAADQQRNTEVDEFFKKGWIDHSSRRYCPDNETRDKFRIWVNEIKEQYCNGLDSSLEDQPFKRSPMEIGWARHVSERLKQQKTNGSTTHIYGLINVLTRMLFKFTHTKQFVIFPVWHPKELPQIAEIVATIMCNAYWYNGGLNHLRAGAFNDKIIEAKSRAGWQESARIAVEIYETYVDIDKVRDTTQRIQAQVGDRLEDVKSEYEQIQAEHARKLRDFLQKRAQRADRTTQAVNEIRANVEDPVEKRLKETVANAQIEAEVSERAEEHIKMPQLELPEDPQFARLVDRRLEECREIVREKMPSMYHGPDKLPESGPDYGLSDIQWSDVNTVGAFIDQVDDTEVEDYQSDLEEEGAETEIHGRY
ncbi:MAG: hypothetical protein Q9191_005791 [Dirinaria sp. TL-2023a]